MGAFATRTQPLALLLDINAFCQLHWKDLGGERAEEMGTGTGKSQPAVSSVYYVLFQKISFSKTTCRPPFFSSDKSCYI